MGAVEESTDRVVRDERDGELVEKLEEEEREWDGRLCAERRGL